MTNDKIELSVIDNNLVDERTMQICKTLEISPEDYTSIESLHLAIERSLMDKQIEKTSNAWGITVEEYRKKCMSSGVIKTDLKEFAEFRRNILGITDK